MANKSRPVDKTKVDATEAVREAGTQVYDTKSGYRLPDGTLVSYEEQDDEAVGPAVDDGTTAVEQGARERLVDDAPEAVTGATEAEIETAIVGARETDAEFAGQSFELSEEQVAEMIAETSGDDDPDGLYGRIGRESVDKGKPGEDLLGGGDDSEPDAPFSGRPAGFEAGPDVREAGVFDLVDQPGADAGDPLSSFLGAAEAKLGRDLGAAPSDTQNASPAHGEHSVAKTGWEFGVRDGNDVYVVNTVRDDGTMRQENFFQPDENGKLVLEEIRLNYADPKDGQPTETVVYPGGSSVTTKLDGTKTTEEIPGSPVPTKEEEEKKKEERREQEREEQKKKQEEEDKKKKEEEDKKKQEEEDKKDEGAKQPDEDHEFVLPEELTVDSDIARLRGLRNQGPDSGDGATDPSEIESEVVGVAGDLPTHAELGESLFGQPDTTVEVGSGGGNVNPGANSQGAGVITPQDDQNVGTGPRRNDDPFDAARPAPEPVAADDADADEGSQPLLPPSDIEGPVDDGPDVPDAIDIHT